MNARSRLGTARRGHAPPPVFVVKTLIGRPRRANLNLLLSLTCRQALWLAPAWHGRGRADSYRALAKALPMPTTDSQPFYLKLNRSA